MMKQEYKDLLEILRCFLHKESFNTPIDYDPALLRTLAAQHSISGIVGYKLKKGMDEWAQAYYATCRETVQKINGFKELEKYLDKESIPHLMVKGYVVREDYPIPQLRTFGDIDIIIHLEDRKKADLLLKSLGYICENDWEPSYSYEKGEEYYEFQTELLDKDPTDRVDYRSFFSDPWKHSIKVGDYRYELDPEFCFLYIFTHLAKHIRSRGAGLRMYLDLAVLLQKDAADWKRVNELVSEIKMEVFFETVLSAVEDWFEVRIPFEYHRVDDIVLDELLKFTLDGGIFGFHGENRSTMMLRDSECGKLSLILRRVFPSAKDIQNRYTYLKKRPWLLPIAWIHRLILNKGRLKREQKLLMRIASSDIERVEQLKQMYKSIGL